MSNQEYALWLIALAIVAYFAHNAFFEGIESTMQEVVSVLKDAREVTLR